MKTFRITFVRNPESGIYSANIVSAKSAEQATAYFQTIGNYEIIECTETNEEPKPGQPVHTVPEEWDAPEEEKATRTAEEIIAKIIEFFKENEDVFDDCIEELDTYNGYLNDDRCYSMDELDELYTGTEPSEILCRAYYGYDAETYTTDESGNKERGQFNPNREYFTDNGYGNLVSTDYKDYSGHLDSYAVEAMSENRDHIDTIEDNEELAELFNELEQAEQ
jgi:hypothetical protein